MIPWLAAASLAGPLPELTFGLKSNPVGAAALGDLWWDVGDDLDLGGHLGVYFYWYELDLRARYQVLGGFLVFSGWAGWEPGWFVPATDPEGPRRFLPHPLARGRTEVNLRNDLAWLYLRGTGLTKYRTEAEYDPFKAAEFPAGFELSGEFSAALMGSPSGAAERKLWIYAEITLEAARTVGWTDRLPRAGVIVEKLTPAISFDLDFYYSLMDNDIGGPGVLGVLWWMPPRKTE